MIPVSINLSRKSISRPDLIPVYTKIAKETGIPLDSVPIEITESTAVRSVEIRPIVRKLNENGFVIHMDDFGSGQSSVNGLHILHVDEIQEYYYSKPLPTDKFETFVQENQKEKH